MPSQRWSIFFPQVSCVSIFIRGSPHFRQSGTLFQAHYFYFCHFDFPNFPWMCSVTVQPRGRQSSIFSNNILNVNQNLHVLVVLQNLSELHKHYFLHILLTEKSNDTKVKWYAVLLHVITSENLGHPLPSPHHFCRDRWCFLLSCFLWQFCNTWLCQPFLCRMVPCPSWACS